MPNKKVPRVKPLCNQKKYDIREILSTTYPVHNQWKIMQSLRNARIISIISVDDGFYCLKLKPESCQYTAFVVNGKKYEFKRMPYGLKGALETYCQFSDQLKLILIQRIKKSHPNIKDVNDKIFPCLEDWIIVTETLEEHKILSKYLLDILHENELKLMQGCSHFAKESVNYEGFTIDYNGLHVCQESIEQIINFPRPKNIKAVRRFIGMVNHYRNHLENIAMIQGPLNKFCATNAAWKWTEEEEESFRKIKQALSNASSLSMLDPNLPFRLYTYVTYEGHGAELVQYNKGNNRENLIRYVSKCFNETEKTYPSLDRQVLSIVSALSEVEDFIKDCECEVITDRSVLLWYNSKKKTSRRLDGWATVLSKCNITLKSYRDIDDEIPVVQMGYISICG